MNTFIFDGTAFNQDDQWIIWELHNKDLWELHNKDLLTTVISLFQDKKMDLDAYRGDVCISVLCIDKKNSSLVHKFIGKLPAKTKVLTQELWKL